MRGDTGQLQRLPDEQVSARLAAYNASGSLERDIELYRESALSGPMPTFATAVLLISVLLAIANSPCL